MASWKKIIVSGSIPELFHISASGNIMPVTDDASSLGSANQQFKDLFIDGTAHIDSAQIDSLGAALDANNQAITNIDVNSGTIDGITLGTNSAVTNAQIDNVNINGNTINVTSGDLTITAAGGDISFGNENLSTTGNIINSPLISGSVASTGSFGLLQTERSVAEIGGSLLTLGGNLTTAGTFTTQNNNLTINAAGAARTLTLTENFTIGDGHAGTLTYSAASKTLTVENTSVLNQDLTTDANVTFADVSATGDVTVGGDLTVNGATTTVATTNLVIQDAFGFFATGSAGTNVDGGIIVQSGSADLTGSALYHDKGSERWSVAKKIASSGAAVTPLESVVTVKEPGDDGAPATADVEYGVGEMFINDDGTIWIYS